MTRKTLSSSISAVRISNETRTPKPSGAYDPGNEAQARALLEQADAQNIKCQDVLKSLQFRDTVTGAIKTLTSPAVRSSSRGTGAGMRALQLLDRGSADPFVGAWNHRRCGARDRARLVPGRPHYLACDDGGLTTANLSRSADRSRSHRNRGMLQFAVAICNGAAASDVSGAVVMITFPAWMMGWDCSHQPCSLRE